jgi:hypothetical protein
VCNHFCFSSCFSVWIDLATVAAYPRENLGVVTPV